MWQSDYITGSNSSDWTIMIKLLPIFIGVCPALSVKKLPCLFRFRLIYLTSSGLDLFIHKCDKKNYTERSEKTH